MKKPIYIVVEILVAVSGSSTILILKFYGTYLLYTSTIFFGSNNNNNNI